MEGFLTMENRHRGFTLIEAMVTVVVLSIGLLGLVQLQARLWSASGDLHSTDEAYLLASNTLEKSAIAQMITADLIADTRAQLAGSATLFAVNLSLTQQQQLAEARVRVEWEHQSGPRSLALDSAIYTNSRASDSRLLLAVD
jgi:prepilin-type N-terminal cleavage/methylation domain-containing protein